ncbi:MarR family winged helix-turn-helix transcriptional regulator [Clostridium sp. Marseille-P299]|uniref:MarR family winged helix-turn-helix transcriptional regulator n=1 Tax=Clostridium sp. Marseille-P299 TaxID=1805477 RepID=UPI000835BFB8|nr:MarR family transcriptional regulator [Clostridium sp. Marseille-P299]
MENSRYKTALEYGHDLMGLSYKIKKLISNRTHRSELYQGEYRMLVSIEHMVEYNNKNNKELPGAKVGDISKNLYLSKSATSKMLRSLEEKDYIERTTMPKDRRNVYVHLSPKGKKLITESKENMNQFAIDVIEELGIEQMDEFIKLMNRLYEIMALKVDKYFECEKNNDNEKGDSIC